MNPIVAGVVLGLVAFAAYKAFFAEGAGAAAAGSGGQFHMQGKARLWNVDLAGQLAAALEKLKATPHSQVERVWVLGPTGPESALARARAIQQSGNLVVTTPNLLAGGGPIGMSSITPAEFLNFADPTAAILPVV